MVAKPMENFVFQIHGRNFVVKCGGDSLVQNQYSHRVDAEVAFYIYSFPVLFLEVFCEQH